MADEPTGWRPEEGETLRGKVTGLEKGWSDYTSAFYPIVQIQKEGTQEAVNVHCFHAVLKRRMLALSPKIGDKLEITYHGQRDSKDGRRKVSVYTVTSDHPQDAQTFWGSMGGEVQPPRTSEPAPDIPISGQDFTQQELAAEDDIPF